MTGHEYQQLALRTARKDLDSTQLLLNGALGLAGESGEVVEAIQEHLCHDHWLDKTQIAKELGDIFWYLAIASSALDVDLDTIFQTNVDTPSADLDSTQRLLNGTLGLAVKSGEVIDTIKKHLFQGHSLNKSYIIEKLGDIYGYLVVSSSALNIELDAILQMNIDKLKARYPDGFEAERSVNRKEGDT